MSLDFIITIAIAIVVSVIMVYIITGKDGE